MVHNYSSQKPSTIPRFFAAFFPALHRAFLSSVDLNCVWRWAFGNRGMTRFHLQSASEQDKDKKKNVAGTNNLFRISNYINTI